MLAKILSTIWHPHQHLWNWRLSKRLRRLPGGTLWDHLLVGVDSLILAAQLIRPVQGSISSARVLYIDCGVHEEGWEIETVHEWFAKRVAQLDILALEANPSHCAIAARTLKHVETLDLRNVALVGPDAGDTVTLYLTRGDGKADSLFAEREDAGAIEVPAVRLSTLLPKEGEYDVVILRMNIEGAEQYVIDDLAEARMVDHIDAYYGMWDDLAKIDPAQDVWFRAHLRALEIRPITFNDRDFTNPKWSTQPRRRLSARLRLWSIRNHMTRTIANCLR